MIKTQKSDVRLRILDLLPQEDVVLVVGELVSSELNSNIDFFTCMETSAKWEFIGRGIPDVKDMEKGIRWIELKHIDGSQELKAGFTLVSEGMT